MSSDWTVNYNGDTVKFKDINSGYRIIENDTGVFFLKKGTDRWEVVKVSNINSPDNVKKINYVISKANTTQINDYFMTLLKKEFPNSVSYEDDAAIYSFLKFTSSFYDDEDVDRDVYVSEYEAVIVNERKYRVGSTVYKDGQKYLVRKEPNGEGYLELILPESGAGYTIKKGGRRIEERVHYINYLDQTGYLSPSFSSIYADYNNQNRMINDKYTVVDFNGTIERRLKASKISEIRYWECFDFSPGYKTKVVASKEGTVTLEEGMLTSKASVSPAPPEPSTDYEDWVIPISGAGWEGDKRSGNSYVALRDIPPLRHKVGKRSAYFFYRKGKNQYKVAYVADYLSYECENIIRKANGGALNWSTKATVDALCEHYSCSIYTAKEMTTLLNATPPKKKAPSTPHINHGSGVKEKLFGKFKTKSSSFDIQIRYSTFLRYKGNNDSMSRGKAQLQLIKYEGSSYKVISTLLSINYNEGDLWNPSKGKWFNKHYPNLEVGTYGFKLILEDTYQDTKTIGIRALPKITQYTTSKTKEYDNTSFTFSVVDSSTGAYIPIEGSKNIIMKGKELRKCFRIVVPKGKEYIIRGKLVRGKAAEGGLTGNGGSVRLNEGVIKYNVIQKEFPLAVSIGGDISKLFPIPGWEIEKPSEVPSDGDEGDVSNPYCWLDVIEVMKYFDPPITSDERKALIDEVSCYPKGTELIGTINNFEEHSKDWWEFWGTNDSLKGVFEDNIEFTLFNPLDKEVDLTLNFTVDDNADECGGGGIINYFGGGFEYWNTGKLIGEGIEEVPSSVRVVIDEYISDHEIVGGCNGSYAEVLIKSGDNVLKTIRIDENGWTDFDLGNLYNYGLKEYDIEIKTYQNGYKDPRGYDIRSTFILGDFNIFTSYELAATKFDSVLDFYVNGEKKFSIDAEGEGEQYFPVKKGKNKYKFVFSTNNWDYNWDYAEIPWIRLTNWICDDVPVVPYCEPGGGDKCIEALIGCVLGLLPKPKPKGCVYIKYINQDTNEVMKEVRYGGYTEGDYTFHAPLFTDFMVVGDKSKTVYIDESGVCAEVEFYYKRIYRGCIHVIYRDKITGNVLLKDSYYDLLPGEYKFNAKDFDGYRLVSDSTKEVTMEYLLAPPEECIGVVFEYEQIKDNNPYLDCVWVIHQEKDNPSNILETEQHYDLEQGRYKYFAKEFNGYEVVGDTEKEIIIKEIVDPVTECKIVIFEYRKIKLGCVIVKFKDRVNDVMLDTDYYYELLPGEYAYHAKEFEGYKLVDNKIKTILLTEEDRECLEIVFLYEPLVKGCAVGKKIWLFT